MNFYLLEPINPEDAIGYVSACDSGSKFVLSSNAVSSLVCDHHCMIHRGDLDNFSTPTFFIEVSHSPDIDDIDLLRKFLEEINNAK